MRELTTRLVRLGDLRPHPENANLGDVQAVRESLRRFGQWRPIVAQVRDGEPLRVLIGHTMLRAAQAEGWDRIAVHERQVDDDEARRILAVDNRTRDLAQTDDAALARLLDSIGDDLSGTSYTDEDRASLRALVEAQDKATLRAMREVADAEPDSEPRSPSRTAAPGGQFRHLTLTYPAAVFDWLIERLDSAAQVEGVDGRSAVVLRLVEQRCGENVDDYLTHVATRDLTSTTAAEVVLPSAADTVDPHTL